MKSHFTPMIAFQLTYILLTSIVTSQNDCDNNWQTMTNFNVGAHRTYYIACVEQTWNYAPSGKNLISGETITEAEWSSTWLHGNGIDRVGSSYVKGLYREYTDSCFTTLKQRTPREQHLGLLGPNIRALTGETIKIFYKNQCTFPNSIHVHGLAYDKTSEGAPYYDTTHGGDTISPNGGWIYIFKARTIQSDENSSKMWIYHSHVDEIRDTYTGLIGAVIVTKKGFETSNTNLMPRDIDREFVTFMSLFDENLSALFHVNVQQITKTTARDLASEEFAESNLMHAINGYLFGNLDTLNCITGEKVRWYTASIGNEMDGPHSPHWHGNIAVNQQGESIDTLTVIPGTTVDVTMLIDEPGTWLFHCHVHDHIEAGMITTYHAEPPPNNGQVIGGVYCCRSKKEPEPNFNGRCWGITDMNECNVQNFKWCQWDQWKCQRTLSCDTRHVNCAGFGINNCCSGYCNNEGLCS